MRSTVMEYQFDALDDALAFIETVFAARESASVMRVNFSGFTRDVANRQPEHWYVRVEASMAVAAKIAEPRDAYTFDPDVLPDPDNPITPPG